MTNFTIDIISDPVCPWCYIGKKRLDRAIALYKRVYPDGRNDTFTLNWKAFYLDASAPAQGISWDERSLQKFSSRPGSNTTNAANTDTTTGHTSSPDQDSTKALVQQLKDRLAKIGQQEGIAFSFRGKIGQTRSAHRAIAFSKKQPNTPTQDPESSAEAQDRFVMALFAAYFEGAADITSHADLAGVAASAGLSGAEMLAWLDSGEGGDEIDAEARTARDRGVRGVPSFTVQGHTLDGAQDVQDFMEMFVKAKEQEQS